MGAKEYLSQALWLDQRINSKLELLETLRAYRCVIISISVYINYYYSIRLF
jgi:hypothetical protein